MADNAPGVLRFSDRVDDYIKYRPHYPRGLMALLKRETGLNASRVVADIGSGTGISSLPFLENGNKVYGIEPNREMRTAAEKLLGTYKNFTSIDGTAEATQLPGSFVDIIFSGQAFHWFNRQQAKKEFLRILKEGGHIVLAWNQRDDKSSFQRDYEHLLKTHISDYSKVSHRNMVNAELREFFKPKPMNTTSLNNHQHLNLAGMKGRLLSASYYPKEGPEYQILMDELEKLFHRYAADETIRFDYETVVYWC